VSLGAQASSLAFQLQDCAASESVGLSKLTPVHRLGSVNASSLFATRTKKCRVCFECGQTLWSAPAERRDGALGRAGIAGSGGAPDGICAKAVSRFACHRTP
jgi:hypothetical protein